VTPIPFHVKAPAARELVHRGLVAEVLLREPAVVLEVVGAQSVGVAAAVVEAVAVVAVVEAVVVEEVEEVVIREGEDTR
jgi:hypothetical protein